jgi:hypothetical protein
LRSELAPSSSAALRARHRRAHGPGYFPRILGILLILLGSALALRRCGCRGRYPRGNGGDADRARCVVLFGMVVTRLGLVLSTILLIVVSSAASHEFRPEASISAILRARLPSVCS